jgi:hypothetical protein
MPRSTAFKNAILDLLRGVDGSFTELKLGLHTGDPGSAGTSNEVSGGSYARQVFTVNTASGGATSNAADINFTGMPQIVDPAFISYVTIWGDDTFIWSGALTTPKEVANAGDTFTIPAGALDLSEVDPS